MNLEFARWLTEQQLRVFPVHGILEGGVCTCAKGITCEAAGKHPVEQGWYESATMDMERCERWHTQYPRCNIGVATGRGLVVVDVDPRNGGFESLYGWEYANGKLPETLSWQTGQYGNARGVHKLLRVPDGTAVQSRRWLAGVEVQGEGKLVVAAGSKHKSGVWYQVDEPVLPIADAPDWLLEVWAKRESTGGGGDRLDLLNIMDGVEEGERNDTLFKAAYHLRWEEQVGEDGALFTLCMVGDRCEPPYPRTLVTDIVRRVYSYADRGSMPGLSAELLAWAQGAGNVDAEGLVAPFTDVGNATRLLRQAAGSLLYVAGWGWCTWDGRRWVPDTLGVAKEAMKAVTREMMPEEGKNLDRRTKQALDAWIQSSQSAHRIRAALEVASSDPLVARSADQFDTDAWLLNTASGTLNLKSGELEEPDPAKMVTKLARAGFDIDAPAPLWEEMIEMILPAKDVRELVQRGCGYSLTGDTSEKVFFVLWGTGDNGKSVMLEALRWVLGDYAGTAVKSVFVERRSDQHTTDIASLRGLRFVTFTEPRKGEKLSVDVIKQFTGGDEVAARLMRQDQFVFHPSCKLWLATNHKPGLSEFGPALSGRIRLIPFEVAIPKAQQRRRDDVLSDLREEAAGILRWCVEGLGRYLADGWLGDTAETGVAKEAWLEEEDQFGGFLEDCTERVNMDVWTSARSVYRVYAAWCGESGRKAWGDTAFGRELGARGVRKSRVRWVVGGPQVRCWNLRLRDEVRGWALGAVEEWIVGS